MGTERRGLPVVAIEADEREGVLTIGLDKSDPFKGSFVSANTSLAQKLAETIEGRIKKPAAAAPVTKLKKS